MITKVREESEIISDLAQVCASPGYIHAIAYICFRDNTIKYADTVTADDMVHQYSMERLARTEISTLIGLARKEQLNTDLPTLNETKEYIEKKLSLY